MARLTEEDRKELLRVVKLDIEQLPLSHDQQFVAPKKEARMRYIRFATQAS